MNVADQETAIIKLRELLDEARMPVPVLPWQCGTSARAGAARARGAAGVLPAWHPASAVALGVHLPGQPAIQREPGRAPGNTKALQVSLEG